MTRHGTLTHGHPPMSLLFFHKITYREGGREEGRERGREEGRERGREGYMIVGYITDQSPLE